MMAPVKSIVDPSDVVLFSVMSGRVSATSFSWQMEGWPFSGEAFAELILGQGSL